MQQIQDNETQNHEVSTENSFPFLPVLNNINLTSEWNFSTLDVPSQQGNSSVQEKDFGLGSYQCNCSSLQSNFSDTSWNMGYQYTPSSCCVIDQQNRRLSDQIHPQVMNEIDSTQFIKDLLDNKNSEYEDGRAYNSFVQSPKLSVYNSPFNYQDNVPSLNPSSNVIPPYSSNSVSNLGFCLENDCLDKFCSTSKNHYSSCLLEQNLDVTNNRTDLAKDNNGCTTDLSIIIPMSVSDDSTILNVNETDDESDIIVEDSDTDSEISIDVGPYIEDKVVEKVTMMRCFVCNLSYSQKAESNFVQVNSSFPLTFISQTPVMLKLIEIIPIEMQTSVKFENNLICRRCLDLIDMIESYEVRLVSFKKAICDFVARPSRVVMDEDWSMIHPYISLDQSIVKDIPPLTPIDKQVKEAADSINVLSGVNDKTSIETIDEIAEIVSHEVLRASDNTNDITDPLVVNRANPQIENLRDNSSTDQEQPERNLNLAGNMKNEQHKNLNEPSNGTTLCTEITRKLSNTPTPPKKLVEKECVILLNDKLYQCDRCGKVYKYENQLVYHLKKHAGEFKVQCSKCGKGFMNLIYLNVHMRKHNEFPCRNCINSFKSETDLTEHLKDCTRDKFSCPECILVFLSEEKLQIHMAKHKREPNICAICKKSFDYPSDLVAHLKCHSEEKPFNCKKCGKSYKNQSHLRRHMKSHEPSLKCPKCKLVLADIAQLKEHSAIHIEKVKCNLCPKMFNNNRFLTKHMKMHKGTKKKEECPVCKKILIEDIKVHMLTHAEVQLFKCDICDVRFTFKNSLVKHQRTLHKKNGPGMKK